MIQVRNSNETLPDSSWRAVFTDTQNFSKRHLAKAPQEQFRQDHKTGLFVRAGRASSRKLTASRSLDTLPNALNTSHNSTDELSKSLATMLLVGGESFHVAEFEGNVAQLSSKSLFSKAVSLLTDLQTIRQFISKAMHETGVLTLLKIMNSTCTLLEEAARRETNNQKSKSRGIERVSSDGGKTENLFYWLERLRQHRRFVLEEFESFHSRPQSLLERALLMGTTFPTVFKNALGVVQVQLFSIPFSSFRIWTWDFSLSQASLLVKTARHWLIFSRLFPPQEAEKHTIRLLSTLDEVAKVDTVSTGAAVRLAFLKSKVREMSLDGSMQTSVTEPVAAAQFRVLAAEVGMRTIQVPPSIVRGDSCYNAASASSRSNNSSSSNSSSIQSTCSNCTRR